MGGRGKQASFSVERRLAADGDAGAAALASSHAGTLDDRLADIAAEATEVERAGPLIGAHRFQRLGRFVPIVLLASLLIAADPRIPVALRVVIVGGAVAGLAVTIVVPWRRLPRDAQGYLMLVPVVCIVALMMQDGGIDSPFSWLEFLPMVWLLLYERRRILVMALALVAAAFAGALLLHPSMGALPGLLPPFIMCLTFPGLHKFAGDARRSMLAQAERANRDPLTGLWNRRGLAHIASANGSAADVDVAAIYIDIDYFKELNDRLGHAAGDDLLKQVSSRLCSSVRPGDLVARVGGDEFLVIARGNAETVARIRDRIDRQANMAPYQIGDEAIGMTLSVGVCAAGRRDDLDVLVRHADRAMLHAKASRPGKAGRTSTSV